MTRRDTIIIATLVNAGLLACLFLVATRQEEKGLETAKELFEPVTAGPEATVVKDEPPLTLHDEVDLALKEFLPDEPKIAEVAPDGLEADLNPDYAKAADPIFIKPETPLQSGAKIVEVTVKSGDMLEKIARANRTTVKAIKEASGLSTDRLKVGQILKVPVGAEIAQAAEKSTPKPVVAGDPVYYKIERGDNPWKIAKKFHVKFEDILKLNNMTEESARNLKVGQEIRVK